MTVTDETGEATPRARLPRVLLMDDHDCVREVVGRLIERMGYDVELARDGSEAIEIFTRAQSDERPFAVVILDLSVPGGMGGAATLTELRKIDQQVRAVASTGDASEAIAGGSPTQEFSSILLKPYSMEELRSVLARLAGRA